MHLIMGNQLLQPRIDRTNKRIKIEYLSYGMETMRVQQLDHCVSFRELYSIINEYIVQWYYA